jgi:hypothetical protein
MKNNRYIITYWKTREEKHPVLEFSEFSPSCQLLRTIRFYGNSIKIADEFGGTKGEWYENSVMDMTLDEFIEGLKNDPEFITLESTSDEFELNWKRQWEKQKDDYVKYEDYKAFLS